MHVRVEHVCVYHIRHRDCVLSATQSLNFLSNDSPFTQKSLCIMSECPPERLCASGDVQEWITHIMHVEVIVFKTMTRVLVRLSLTHNLMYFCAFLATSESHTKTTTASAWLISQVHFVSSLIIHTDLHTQQQLKAVLCIWQCAAGQTLQPAPDMTASIRRIPLS